MPVAVKCGSIESGPPRTPIVSVCARPNVAVAASIPAAISRRVAVRVMAWFPEWFRRLRNAGIMVVGLIVPTMGFAVKGLL